MANIGFIGLGMMGKPMAEPLIKGGRAVCFCICAVGCCGHYYSAVQR
ncbi:MAG: NAD(P)-binding domain-containing protein [Pseudomonadota bacterium]